MKKNNAVLLSTPYLIWMVLFTLIPLGVMVYYALTDPATGVFSLVNIRQLGMYLPVLWTSIVYSFISAVICLILGYPVAYFIAHCGQTAQRFLYMLVMLPMCMSFLLRTLAWVGLLQDTGIINNLLETLGFARIRLIRTPAAVVLGMVYNYLPYMILPLYSTIVKIDHRLVEAAEDLGCNGVQTFRRVIFPLSVPGSSRHSRSRSATSSIPTFTLVCSPPLSLLFRFFRTPSMLSMCRAALTRSSISASVVSPGRRLRAASRNSCSGVKVLWNTFCWGTLPIICFMRSKSFIRSTFR